jgi:hypothetical protein
MDGFDGKDPTYDMDATTANDPPTEAHQSLGEANSNPDQNGLINMDEPSDASDSDISIDDSDSTDAEEHRTGTRRGGYLRAKAGMKKGLHQPVLKKNRTSKYTSKMKNISAKFAPYDNAQQRKELLAYMIDETNSPPLASQLEAAQGTFSPAPADESVTLDGDNQGMKQIHGIFDGRMTPSDTPKDTSVPLGSVGEDQDNDHSNAPTWFVSPVNNASLGTGYNSRR